MITLQGKSVFEGIAAGKLVFYRRPGAEIWKEARRRSIEDREAELLRFERAREQAVKELEELEQRAGAAGEAGKAILTAHELLLGDPEYGDNVRRQIAEQGVNAEYAVSEACREYYGMLRSMEDPYLRERAADVEDISERLLRILSGGGEQSFCPEEPVILAADDLAPSDTVQLPADKVLGFVMRRGSVQSHTAILARSMGAPAIVDAGPALREEYEGEQAVIDGGTGTLYIQPEPELVEALREKKREQERQRLELAALAGRGNRTLDGREIRVCANAGSLKDVEKALENDAGGIGLLRSELLYLEGEEAPGEEKQFAFYRSVLEKMHGKTVVIRTMDIGADKQAPWLRPGMAEEENPAMGLRAIRLGLSCPKLFKTQLRALYRAGLYGKLSIMYPMITSLEELRGIRELEREAKAELKAGGEPFAEGVPTGIMIETPAAALISDSLAEEADFFSIGTNDLTQYTLAVDRGNARLDAFWNPHHEAVLRLIELTVKNAGDAGIPVGICGELAADLSLTEYFLRLGLDELSVAPGRVLSLRQRIRTLDLREPSGDGPRSQTGLSGRMSRGG